MTVDGEQIAVDSWPGMIGHNWGSEHAERWTWIQANDFGLDDTYFDAALGRIKVGAHDDAVGRQRGALPRSASDIASAASSESARPRSTEQPTECEFELTGKDVRVRGRVAAEPRKFVAWVYADPAGPEHNTLNCSISDLELTVERRGRRRERLECVGAAAYELGVRETDHGIAVQPFADG